MVYEVMLTGRPRKGGRRRVFVAPWAMQLLGAVYEISPKESLPKIQPNILRDKNFGFFQQDVDNFKGGGRWTGIGTYGDMEGM